MKHYLEKELETLLKADSEIFKFIQNHSLDGLWYWDLENPDEEFMDTRFWEVLGFDPETKKHTPQEWFDLIDPIHLELAKENVDKHCADPNHPYDQVVRYTHKSGKDVWVRCRGVAIRDENGKAIRLLGCHNDITDLKESESRTLELLKSYRALVDTESLFYIKTDVAGNYTYANNCFLKRFGYKLDEILGTSSLNSILPEDHPKTYKIVTKCFMEPNIPHRVILRKPYGDGLVRSNQWEFYGVTDKDGKVVEVICVGVEITDLMDRTMEMQRLLNVEADKNQRLQEHSYIISHNIRNSVANMLGIFDLINDDPEDKDTYIELLKSSTLALEGTIKNLNKLLSEEKKAEYDRLEEINVSSELQRIIELETAEIVQLKAKINLNCSEEITIKTLPAYFDSVFHNLISNALKYGLDGNGNHIDINVGFINERLHIEVKDYGDGFDLPNNAELLFRLETRLDREKIGQGLGLFITKHHVKLINASIEVASQVGKGTSFKVIWNE